MAQVEASESTFENIPEDTIVSAFVKEIDGPVDTDWGPRLDFTFEVTEAPWSGLWIKDRATLKFTIDPPSKLYEWACAITGKSFSLGDKFDTDELLNEPCRVMVGWKEDQKTEGKFWMKVAEIMPPRGAPSTSADQVFG